MRHGDVPWAMYIEPKVANVGPSVQTIWGTENLKQTLDEPIKKMMKESVLNSATESSCHHSFFVYLAKHL